MAHILVVDDDASTRKLFEKMKQMLYQHRYLHGLMKLRALILSIILHIQYLKYSLETYLITAVTILIKTCEASLHVGPLGLYSSNGLSNPIPLLFPVKGNWHLVNSFMVSLLRYFSPAYSPFCKSICIKIARLLASENNPA